MIPLQSKIPRGQLLAIQVLSTGPSAYAIAISNEDREVSCTEWRVDPETGKAEIKSSELRQLKRVLEDPSITKVCHDAKPQLRALEQGLGITVQGTIHDTQLAHFVCKTYLPHCHLATASGKLLEMDRSANAAVQNIIVVMRLWAALQVRLTAEDGWDAYELERQLLPVVLRMENRGIRIDRRKCLDCIEENHKRKQDCYEALREISGDPKFNPNKPEHVRKLLFETLGLESAASTPTGKAKTDQQSLSRYVDEPAARLIVEYRATKHATDTFFAFYDAAIRDSLSRREHSIHSTFNQDGTRTGRHSSSDPPLHSTSDGESSRSRCPISTRTPLGPRHRYFWLSIDFSQIETRIFAAASGVELFHHGLSADRDVHVEIANATWGGEDNPRAIETAMEILGTSSRSKAIRWLEEFDYRIADAEQDRGGQSLRSRAKTLVYARLMGGRHKPVMQALQCSESEAQELVGDLDRTIPGIPRFLRDRERIARRCGYSTTLFGRRLHHHENDYWLAGSHIVQGTAADLIKRRMVACDDYFRSEGLDAHIVLTIHDELIFEIHRTAFTGRVVRRIKQIMEADGEVLGIDLPVGISLISRSWSEKTEIDISKFSNGRIISWKGKYATVRSKTR